MRQAQGFVEGLSFGECPRWHDGKLWFADFYQHTVFTADTNGRLTPVVEVPGQPSGLGWLPDGRLLVVSMIDRRVLRLEAGGLVEHADLMGIATFHGNDMVVDAQGRAYVGNFGFDLDKAVAAHGIDALLQPPGPPTAALVRVEADGTAHVAAPDLAFPNGMVITPDGRTLIVAESLGFRLTAFAVQPDGSLTNRRVWAQFQTTGPDGICLDAAGAIWVANALAPECLRVREGGEVLDRVATRGPCFACMLGGEDRRTLFLCTADRFGAAEAAVTRDGRIEQVRVDVPGAGWP